MVMKLIALFSFISVAFAAPELLGTKECTYGPSYWCSHISRAQKCGAIQHCMSTIWKNQIINPKKTDQCTGCQLIINIAKEMVKNKAAEEEIKKQLPKVCDLIPDAKTKATCETDMKEYLPFVLDFLKSNMTAEKICALLGICTGFEDTVPHREVKTQEVKINTDQVCNDCITFFKDVQNMITNNETVKQMEDQLKQILCGQLGPLEGVCDFVVEEYVPQLMMYVGEAVNPPTTCRIIGFCNTNGDIQTALKVRMQFMKMIKELKKEKVGGQEECDACKSIMSDIQSLDRDPTAQEKVKDFVKTFICERLSALQSECDNLVDTYAPVLFDLLANELDPVTTCTALGLCTSTTIKSKKQPMKAISLVPAMPVKKVKTSGKYCFVCKIAMQYVNKEIVANKTQEEIKNLLNQICARLPGTLPPQCTAFVSEYLPSILELLEKEADPTTICDKLGLCTPLKPQRKIKAESKADVKCVTCEFVMDKLESIISKNTSQAEVEVALDKVCSLLPSTISSECNTFVQQYTPMIVQLLLQEVKPKQVCSLLGLCTSVTRVLPKPFVTGILLRGEPVINKQQNGELCQVCEQVFGYVAMALKENKTAEELKTWMEDACTVLQVKEVVDECQGIVLAFGDMIIAQLANAVDPKEICTMFKLCNSSTINKEQIKSSFNNILKNAMMKQKKTQDNKLYFTSVKRLGERKCSYGPTYWCASLDNAKRCGMEEHCRRKGWLKN